SEIYPSRSDMTIRVCVATGSHCRYRPSSTGLWACCPVASISCIAGICSMPFAGSVRRSIVMTDVWQQPAGEEVSHYLNTGRWTAISKQLSKPWFAYLMILLLQMKVVWGWWTWSDLTMGDTSSYFCGAYRWFESFHVNIVWSPLYTAFYGSFLFLTSD